MGSEMCIRDRVFQIVQWGGSRGRDFWESGGFLAAWSTLSCWGWPIWSGIRMKMTEIHLKLHFNLQNFKQLIFDKTSFSRHCETSFRLTFDETQRVDCWYGGVKFHHFQGQSRPWGDFSRGCIASKLPELIHWWPLLSRLNRSITYRDKLSF